MFFEGREIKTEKNENNQFHEIFKKPQLLSEKINNLMEEGKVFIRSIICPTIINTDSKYGETNWELELRKVARKPGIATKTSKEDLLHKDGNKNRSTKMIYPGSRPYLPLGYGIIEPNLEDIKAVTHNMDNLFSGFGKKKHANLIKIEDNEIDQNLTNNQKLESLLNCMKSAKSKICESNEVMMDIKVKNINFIYYTSNFDYSTAKQMQKTAQKYLKKDIPILKFSYELRKFEEVK